MRRYNNCIILKAFYSDYAKGNWKNKPQWKSVVSRGNLREITTEQELLEWHNETIGEDGLFRIISRDLKGHFSHACKYIVSNDGGKLEFTDQRKAMPRKFLKAKEDKQKGSFVFSSGSERVESVPSPM